jgi:AraC-like DNA-binding protein
MASPLPHEEIVSYIRANLARRITLDEIAGIAQLSVFQLVRAFRRESETTPYRLIVDLRIEHAKALLARGDSIADAACCAGFADQSHLTRHFRRRTGFTPKRYMAAAKVAA